LNVILEDVLEDILEDILEDDYKITNLTITSQLKFDNINNIINNKNLANEINKITKSIDPTILVDIIDIVDVIDFDEFIFTYIKKSICFYSHKPQLDIYNINSLYNYKIKQLDLYKKIIQDFEDITHKKIDVECKIVDYLISYVVNTTNTKDEFTNDEIKLLNFIIQYYNQKTQIMIIMDSHIYLSYDQKQIFYHKYINHQQFLQFLYVPENTFRYQNRNTNQNNQTKIIDYDTGILSFKNYSDDILNDLNDSNYPV